MLQPERREMIRHTSVAVPLQKVHPEVEVC